MVRSAILPLLGYAGYPLAIVGAAPINSAGLDRVLWARDSDELIDWLRRRPLAHYDRSLNTLMVHAGVIPQWSAREVMARLNRIRAEAVAA